MMVIVVTDAAGAEPPELGRDRVPRKEAPSMADGSPLTIPNWAPSPVRGEGRGESPSGWSMSPRTS